MSAPDQEDQEVFVEEGAPTELEWDALSAGHLRAIAGTSVRRSCAVSSAKSTLSRIDGINQVSWQHAIFFTSKLPLTFVVQFLKGGSWQHTSTRKGKRRRKRRTVPKQGGDAEVVVCHQLAKTDGQQRKDHRELFALSSQYEVETNWTDKLKGAKNIQWNARAYHTLVSFKGRLWMLGGNDKYGSVLNEVLSSVDGLDWVEEANDFSSFSPRGYVSAVAQKEGNGGDRMVLLCGRDGVQLYNDVWHSYSGT
jgi:hypothetical protein